MGLCQSDKGKVLRCEEEVVSEEKIDARMRVGWVYVVLLKVVNARRRSLGHALRISDFRCVE